MSMSPAPRGAGLVYRGLHDPCTPVGCRGSAVRTLSMVTHAITSFQVACPVRAR